MHGGPGQHAQKPGAPNQPLAAAYTLFPAVIIVVYLLAMKRAGAFDNL